MNCKKVREELIFLFAEEMDHDQHAEFKDHVKHCPQCAKKAEKTRFILTFVRQHTVRCEAPSHLREKILSIMPHRR